MLGFEVDPLNTVSLSNHTGYAAGFGAAPRLDAAAFGELLAGLRRNGLLGGYSGLLTGYVGDAEVVRAVAAALPELRRENPGLVWLCDPVMGDNGRYYVSEDCAAAYKDVAPLADVLTPNQFELEALAGFPVRGEADALRAMGVLHARGVRTVITSSIQYEGEGADAGGEAMVRALASEMPRVEGSYTGTGDVLAATTLAWLQRLPGDLPSALERALATVRCVLERTHERAGAGAELRLVECAPELAAPAVRHRVRRLWPGGELPTAAAPPRAVVFDMDGTLTEAGNVDFAAMREIVGARPGERVDIVARLNDHGVPAETRAAWEARIAAMETDSMRETPLRPGVLEWLAHLRASGIKVGILTRNCDEATRVFLEMYGLADAFDAVETRAARFYKPDPRSLSVAFCERWGVAPEETLYVGDSEHDLATARAAGCVFGLVEDAASPRPLTRAAADIVGATIGEIMLAGGVPPMR
eukprot:PRCOL_00006483-RA